ncbi:tail fiber domain-containing protein [Bacteriovorax sp. PP10]|uniref:Tail fiber domain-containing protein n=1 Tax=Bacteriovorax antarcticus TaxID=3088717 RepID=A0ABU5VU71_9BACT|nr:tail fiber domain-containing protein [Bacteriovorax sp. PP10]MEA9355928.1 tail fiber domain-containing protein [Bacteriovorax sp. PP10]
MRKQNLKLLILLILISGCIADKGKIDISLKRKTNTSVSVSANVSSVQIINNQLVITGAGFTDISAVKVNGNSLNQDFSIESKTDTKIIANSLSAVSFDVSKLFHLILSDANASATFPIDFSLCSATLNGFGFNCAITAIDKDVLSYDANTGTWKPRASTGINYLGAFNASANPPAPTPNPFPTSGSYYIVSADGMIGATSFVVGDWLISNGTAWQKIGNSTLVTSVFSRTGNIVAQEGDYDLDKLTDVDLSVAPVNGKVLKFNGTHWVAADDLSGGGAASVVTATIADGAVTDAKITAVAASKITGTINSSQILDGTIVNADINAAAAIDYSKLNIPAATIPYAKLNIADGDIPAAKISGLTAVTTVLATAITDADTTHAPDGNSVYDALALKLNTSGGALTSAGTISNVPNPVGPLDVSNRQYVDTKLDKTAGGTVLGSLSLDTDVKLKGTANYVTLKADGATTAYTFTLPPSAGTSGQVLTTNGLNPSTLSWTTPTSVTGTTLTGDIGGTVGANTIGSGKVTLAHLSATGTKNNTTYLRGDNTWSTFITDVRDATLGTVTPTVSIPLLPITTGDTLAVAFNKTQGQLNNIAANSVTKDGVNFLTGATAIQGMTARLTVPTPLITDLGDATNVQYVSNAIAAATVWTTAGPDVYRATGNVGVGTTTPTASLSIAGTATSSGTATLTAVTTTTTMTTSETVTLNVGDYLIPTTTPAQARTVTVGGTGTSFTVSPAFTANVTGENFTVYPATMNINGKFVVQGSTGNVGIGTSRPDSGLSIVGGGSFEDDLHIDAYTETQEGAIMLRRARGTVDAPTALLANDRIGFLAFRGYTGTTFNEVASISGHADTDLASVLSGHLRFFTRSAGSYFERIRLASNGYVGMGTTTPAHALDVYGDCIAWMGNCINTTGPSNVISYVATTLKFSSNGTQAINLNRFLGAQGTAVATTDIDGVLVTRGGILSNIYVRADANTNDGITSFTIYKNAASTGVVVSLAAATTTASDTVSSIPVAAGDRISARVSTLGTAGVLTRAMLSVDHVITTNVFSSQWATNGSDISFSGGSVGIGTTTPAYNLEVNGTVAGTSAYATTSDGRFKKDITVIPNALEKLTSLEGVYYFFRSDEFPEKNFSHHREMGVIAQKVEKVFPEAVSRDDKGFRSVAYTMLIAPIIESIKIIKGRLIGHDKELQIQKKEIAFVKQQNAKLLEENTAIKSYLCSRDPNASICK